MHDNEGTVRVRIAVDASALERNALRPLLDGKPYGPDRRMPEFVLENVDRGEHVLPVQLQAEVGVECMLNRGCLASQSCTAGCAWVA